MVVASRIERRPKRRHAERYTLTLLVQMTVVAAVLFGIMASPSRQYPVLLLGAFVGMILGFGQGLCLGRGGRSTLVTTMAGLAVGAVSTKILLGEARLGVVVFGSLLILATALTLRTTQVRPSLRRGSDEE